MLFKGSTHQGRVSRWELEMSSSVNPQVKSPRMNRQTAENLFFFCYSKSSHFRFTISKIVPTPQNAQGKHQRSMNLTRVLGFINHNYMSKYFQFQGRAQIDTRWCSSTCPFPLWSNVLFLKVFFFLAHF